MSINIGNYNVSNIKLGSTQVTKVYQGTNEIWSNYVDPGYVTFVYQYNGGGITHYLPFNTNYNYDVYVDWGDGSPTEHLVLTAGNFSSSDYSHTYNDSNTGNVSIKLWGTAEAIDVSNDSYLLRVEDGGSIGVTGPISGFEMTYTTDICGGAWSKNATSISIHSVNNLVTIGPGFMIDNITSLYTAFYDNGNLENLELINSNNVTDMTYTFYGCSKLNDPSLSNLNTSSVTTMDNTFANASSFNVPINNWDVSSVTDMREMFYSASSFNQPLNNWDVSSVSYFNGQFSYASSFDQSLGAWNIASASDMSNMLDNCGMSVANYDDTLIGWSNNPNTPNNITLGAAGLKYSSNAVSARDNLINNKGWTINDDGQV